MRRAQPRPIIAGRRCNATRVDNYVTITAKCDTSGGTIGYGRVSTRDQHPEAQDDALIATGCERVFIDEASGKLARRPELDNALPAARAGDQLVITKLDHLGRSLEHLIDLSNELQQRNVDLIVLDQGIDTSTAVGRMFFQILGSIARFSDKRAHPGRAGRRPGLRPGRRAQTQTSPSASQARPGDVRPGRRRRQEQVDRRPDRRRVRRHAAHHPPLPRPGGYCGHRICLLI